MSNVKNFEGLSLQQLAEALLASNTARKEAEEAEEAVKAAWKARVDAGEVPMAPKGKSRVWTGEGVAVSINDAESQPLISGADALDLNPRPIPLRLLRQALKLDGKVLKGLVSTGQITEADLACLHDGEPVITSRLTVKEV